MRVAVLGKLRGFDAPQPTALAELKSLLKKDRKLEERTYAADALNKLGGAAEEAAPSLTEALDDPDKEVRRLAMEALRKIGERAPEKAFPGLAKAFRNYPELRAAAASALGKIGPKAKDAVLDLAARLEDSDEKEEVRRLCAEALGEIGSVAQPALPKLLKLAADTNERALRKPALSAAIKIGRTESSIVALKDIVLKDPNDSDEQIRILAADGLCKIGTKEDWVPALYEPLLKDRAKEIRICAANGLVKFGAEKDFAALATALSGETDVTIRRHFADSLAKILPAQKEVATKLDIAKTLSQKLPKENDEGVKSVICQCLASLGEPAQVAVDGLLDLLTQDNLSLALRTEAGKALGAIPPSPDRDAKKYIERLMTALKYWEGKKRDDFYLTIVAAIGNVGERGADPLYVYLPQGKDPWEKWKSRLAAVDGLGRIGPPVKKAKNYEGIERYLLAMSKTTSDDPVVAMRQAAIDALENIKK